MMARQATHPLTLPSSESLSSSSGCIVCRAAYKALERGTAEVDAAGLVDEELELNGFAGC
jgi:hypothetical protein